MATALKTIECKICGHKEKDYLVPHLLEEHDLTTQEYLDKYPGAPITSQRLLDSYQNLTKNTRRAHPIDPKDLTIKFAKIEFAVNPDVPASACLPLPAHYAIPTRGMLGDDIQHAVTALKFCRSQYIWGMPGTGKDALFHAWSALTRTPAIIKQVKPGTDIEAWFFTRSFNEKETFWEEGAVIKALRDGYLTESGRQIPYMILLTDFDRADREQGEHLRLITDSIEGRVDGPAGDTYKVLPKTYLVATANTAGSGDERGRMISANPLDASLLDRFERKFQFHWMEWKDEGPILKAKFPLLVQKTPSAFPKMAAVIKAIRAAILNGDMMGELSHRGVCSILGHAQDLLVCNQGHIPENLLKIASRAWLDGLPDEENRDAARKMMDSHFKMLDEGDTSHISKGGLDF